MDAPMAAIYQLTFTGSNYGQIRLKPYVSSRR